MNTTITQPLTKPSTRDAALDYLKGLACFLMVIAHLPVQDKTNIAAVTVHGLAEYITVVFFAVSGINTFTQAKKYNLRYLLLLNVAIFIAGIPYAMVVHANLYAQPVPEILQIIAMGSLAVVAVQRILGNSPHVFALVAILIMVIKVLRDLCLPEFHGAGLLFVDKNYIPRAQLTGKSSSMFPGFPVFPWLAYFVWGVFAYSLSQRAQALMIAIIVSLMGLAIFAGIFGDLHEKWDTSVAFQLSSLLTLSICLFVTRSMPEPWLHTPRWMLFFGEHSLAFLLVHGFGLVAGFIVAKLLGQFAAWAVALTVTYFCLKGLLRWGGAAAFKTKGTWVITAAMCVVLPAIVLVWPASYLIVVIMNVLLGVLIARHFGDLRNLIRSVA